MSITSVVVALQLPEPCQNRVMLVCTFSATWWSGGDDVAFTDACNSKVHNYVLFHNTQRPGGLGVMTSHLQLRQRCKMNAAKVVGSIPTRVNVLKW